jgi:hypothetical protein
MPLLKIWESVQPFDLFVTSYRPEARPGVKVDGLASLASGNMYRSPSQPRLRASSEGQEKRWAILNLSPAIIP